jgi:hypothetical protein
LWALTKVGPGRIRRSQEQFYHARYHDQDENIFFQIQNQPVPDQPLGGPTHNFRGPDLFPLYLQLRSPESGLIADDESPYIHFFLQKLPLNMGFSQLFPTVFETIFAQSMFNPGLRYMVLALSSYLADNMANRPPLRSYRYLQMAIPEIQRTISEEAIDDGLAFAVFLAAYLHLIGGELASSRRHLEGLRIILDRYRTPGQHRSGLPPELMFIRRMAVRIDHKWALGNHEAVFPLISKKDEERRWWIEKLVDHAHPEYVDWALAQFALDDFFTRAIAINKRAIQLRANSNRDVEFTESAINTEAEKLIDEHSTWNDRRCVKTASDLQRAEQIFAEQNGELKDTPAQHRFLHYTPLKFSDMLYAAIRVQYHWIYIYITFITHPQPGPIPFERVQAAIEVCRIYAAIDGNDVCGICRAVMGFYLTGLTFGEPMYPIGNSHFCMVSNVRI